MPRYHLFAGEDYYPGIGLDDYRGSFDSAEEAAAAADAARNDYGLGGCPAHGWACVLVESGGGLAVAAKTDGWTKDGWTKDGPPALAWVRPPIAGG